MQCETFQLRIQQRLDQRLRLGEDGELLLHADECPVCRETLSLYESLLAEVAARSALDAPALEVDDAFTERVMTALRTTVRRESQPSDSLVARALPWLAPLAAAAAVFLAVSLIPDARDPGTGHGLADPSLAESKESTLGGEALALLEQWDSARLRLDEQRIALVGYETGRTVATLPEKMQFAAVNSVTATLGALRGSHEHQTPESRQSGAPSDETSLFWAPSESQLNIV